MNLFVIPWLELAVFVPLVGATVAVCLRDPKAAARCGIGFTAATLVCAIIAWVGHESGAAPGGGAAWDVLPRLLGRQLLVVDQLSAPLLPLVALLHFLAVV